MNPQERNPFVLVLVDGDGYLVSNPVIICSSFFLFFFLFFFLLLFLSLFLFPVENLPFPPEYFLTIYSSRNIL